jgi:two-component system, OmpR family, KDP operon response regulator KdpE
VTDQCITILLVDDDQRLVELLSLAVLAEGWWPLAARSTAFAIRVLTTRQPKLVILDADLPGGLESLRTMRAMTEAPIVVVSESRTEENKVRALDLGADDYVSKPYGLRELLARIRARLRRGT